MASLAQHAFSINRTVGSARCVIRKRVLHARLTLQPTLISQIYTIHIMCPDHDRPTVSVVDPVLEHLPNNPRLPHVYENDRLCLNLPDEWTSNDLLGDTVVPWAAEWLMYYELWLATDGAWLGGGHS